MSSCSHTRFAKHLCTASAGCLILVGISICAWACISLFGIDGWGKDSLGEFTQLFETDAEPLTASAANITGISIMTVGSLGVAFLLYHLTFFCCKLQGHGYSKAAVTIAVLTLGAWSSFGGPENTRFWDAYHAVYHNEMVKAYLPDGNGTVSTLVERAQRQRARRNAFTGKRSEEKDSNSVQLTNVNIPALGNLVPEKDLNGKWRTFNPATNQYVDQATGDVEQIQYSSTSPIAGLKPTGTRQDVDLNGRLRTWDLAKEAYIDRRRLVQHSEISGSYAGVTVLSLVLALGVAIALAVYLKKQQKKRRDSFGFLPNSQRNSLTACELMV